MVGAGALVVKTTVSCFGSSFETCALTLSPGCVLPMRFGDGCRSTGSTLPCVPGIRSEYNGTCSFRYCRIVSGGTSKPLETHGKELLVLCHLESDVIGRRSARAEPIFVRDVVEQLRSRAISPARPRSLAAVARVPRFQSGLTDDVGCRIKLISFDGDGVNDARRRLSFGGFGGTGILSGATRARRAKSAPQPKVNA